MFITKCDKCGTNYSLLETNYCPNSRNHMTHPAKREVHFQAHELNSKRKEANEAILKKLTEYLQANPGMRFNQALSNLKIVEESGDYYNGMTYYWENEYYTEPMDILKRMK